MKYLLTTVAAIVMCMPSALADAPANVRGFAFHEAKGKGEWVKVTPKTPGVGIGKNELMLHAKAKGWVGLQLELSFPQVKGMTELTFHFRRAKDLKDKIYVAAVFDAGPKQEKRPAVLLDKCVLKDLGNGYWSATVTPAILDVSPELPLKAVYVNYDNYKYVDATGPALGSVVVKTDKGEIIHPDNISLDIGTQPNS